MIPELGHFAIILALMFALTQFLAPILGYGKKDNLYFQLSYTAALGQFSFLLFAMLCLIACFMNNDMSVVYVQEHSHQLLPFLYRIGAAWGGHEGSLLLWCLILSGWTLAFLVFRRFVPPVSPSLRRGVITVLGFISTGFILFLFATSDPFRRVFPTAPMNGDDLTPILQDPGLIFHPPMLYMGYVGFAIGFAFAICALISGKLDKEWARAARPWVVLPWGFLSCGIVLGSWWAYRELGWGGWWFWDPVENASLLPWLSATAFIHALIVSEKRNTFKGWTLLLAIMTFALSLLGTFLVRSGILVSVHTFASDPTRGIFLLSYLALIIGGAFTLYSCRIKHFYQAPTFNLFSRETFLLINSVILLTCVITILIGTLYPIILDSLNLEKISVGEPYFNTVFLPMILPLLLLMGFAPHIRWGEQSVLKLWQKLRLNILFSLLLGISLPILLGFHFHWLASTGIAAALWIALSTLQYVYQLKKCDQQVGLQHGSMIVAHLGIAVMALGITVTKSYSEERQVRINLNETVVVANYQFTLKQLNETAGENYKSISATFTVQNAHGTPSELIAEQRIYASHDQSLSKPGIQANVFRDLYLALGSSLPDGGWSVRIYYKPFVRWIWAGGFMLLLGGLLSLLSSIQSRGRK
jgi:cytochrome c-type biogenesis protein CcmF